MGGMKTWCIDLFADADLMYSREGRSIPPSEYPLGFLKASRQAPPGPWIYTGALENYPDLIDCIGRERLLWGNSSNALRVARSPQRIAEVLRRAGFSCPTNIRPASFPSSKKFLMKPLKSAGGANIHWWTGQAVSNSFYVQEWIDGPACSALYVGRHDHSATFLGATQQLVGLSWLHAEAFHYCGNLAPLDLLPSVREQLQNLGTVLAGAFSLLGFFGVDFILQNDVPFPVEINPRYTAGIEILERATGNSLFAYHRDVFSTPLIEPTFESTLKPQNKTDSYHAKAILFAKAPLIFPPEGPWLDSLTCSWGGQDYPEYADIPHPNSRIEKGQPILTLFAQASTEENCLEILREKAQTLDRRLFAI